ncbi:MAG TPA: hypothetical protein VJ945_05855 [Flavobacteriaceae bacterium]|nr:hypothetical protein [Flavobacteriaceae bacterium]
MKTSNYLKIGIGVVLIVGIGLISLKSFAHKTKTSADPLVESKVKTDDTIIADPELEHANVSVTIDAETTDDQINDIVNLLKENNITPTFTNIKRNDDGKITGIEIVLEDANGNQTSSETASNVPISQIVFGRKDGFLYINQSKMDTGALAFFNRPNMMPFPSENDSIMKQHFGAFGNFNFDDFFNDENDGSFFMNGKSMTIDELREQMKKHFSDQLGNQNFSWFFDNDNAPNAQQKFKFYDDPNTDKLIIIDGKESDFETLNSLAKSDQLKAVDNLKPETAISIYGDKAKDGAIIATTKK